MTTMMMTVATVAGSSCFLWMKLLRDVLSLAAGGALLYACVRWRHWIFRPLMWPFARVERIGNVRYGDSGRETIEYRYEFVARGWWEMLDNQIMPVVAMVISALAVIVIVGGMLFIVGRFLWHLYYVC